MISTVKMFYVREDHIKISDHGPISVELMLSLDVSLVQMKQSINDIAEETNNHSKTSNLKMENIDEHNNYTNYFQNSTEKSITELKNIFYQSAKGARILKSIPVSAPQTEDICNTNAKMNIVTHSRNEYSEWEKVLSTKDPKRLWEKIDWEGKFKNEEIKPDASLNEFTDFIEKRCSLPKEHSKYEDLNSSIFNPILDSKITEEEVLETARA